MAYTTLKTFNVLGFKKFVYSEGLHWPLFFKSWKYLYKEIFKKQTYAFKTNKADPFIIDCGANVGYAILYFKKLYPQSTIIGFEANPYVFEKLNDCVKINNFKNTSLHNFALADQDNQQISFYIDHNGGLGSSILQRQGLKEKVTVNTVKLSNYIDRPVDFIKIDIEGAENMVLQDLDNADKMKFLEKGVIEFHYVEGNSMALTLEILEKNNLKYKIKSCDKDAVIIRFKKHESGNQIIK